jgi:hypothetical protein
VALATPLRGRENKIDFREREEVERERKRWSRGQCSTPFKQELARFASVLR